MSSGSFPIRAAFERTASVVFTPLGRFPARIRDQRFWRVQGLVFVATAAHYFIEASGYTNPYETLHSLAISLYILPLLYAALTFGWEGTILTALWASVLTSPSTWIWHHSEFHWFGELGQLGVTLLVGVIVAWRVDREARERRRAETTSAELSVLNDIGAILSYTLEVEAELPRVLRRLAAGMGAPSTWLCLESESQSGAPSINVENMEGRRGPSAAEVLDLDRQLRSGPEGLLLRDNRLAVRLLGEGRTLGSLGIALREGGTTDGERRRLLTTVAAQIGVAVENARSYRQRQESLHTYARHVTRAQEDERLRIARELHDETAQALVQIRRKLEAVKQRAPDSVHDELDQIISMARDELVFIRRFARDLRPPVLDVLGLAAALEVLVSEAGEHFPGGAQLTVSGERQRLDSTIELELFRIAQEAVRNVERHSGASSVQVALAFTGEDVRLEVADDGRGFSIPSQLGSLSRQGKLGLLGMKERAELIGGTFSVSSSSTAGTRIVVQVPQSMRSGAEGATDGASEVP